MNNSNQDYLRERLKEVRDTHGTTFSFIAEKLGVSRAIISLFVAGKRGISDENEIKLKKFLNETFPKKED